MARTPGLVQFQGTAPPRGEGNLVVCEKTGRTRWLLQELEKQEEANSLQDVGLADLVVGLSGLAQDWNLALPRQGRE